MQSWCVLVCDTLPKIVSEWSLWAIAGLLHWYIRYLFGIPEHKWLWSLLMHVVLQLAERLFM